MGPLTAIFVYLLIWWIMLFTILPFGIKRNDEAGKGFDAGAPVKPDIKKKMLVNTLVSAVILGIIQILVVKGIIDWHSLYESAAK